MGHVYHQVQLYAKRAKRVRMFVDTGATYSIIPPALARYLGVALTGIKHRVQLADRRFITMDASILGIRVMGREVPSTVLIGAVEEPILGAETLEALGLAVDPCSGKLKKARSWTIRVGTVIGRRAVAIADCGLGIGARGERGPQHAHGWPGRPREWLCSPVLRRLRLRRLAANAPLAEEGDKGKDYQRDKNVGDQDQIRQHVLVYQFPLRPGTPTWQALINVIMPRPAAKVFALDRPTAARREGNSTTDEYRPIVLHQFIRCRRRQLAKRRIRSNLAGVEPHQPADHEHEHDRRGQMKLEPGPLLGLLVHGRFHSTFSLPPRVQEPRAGPLVSLC